MPRETLEAIAERMAQGISTETANHYIRAIRRFTRWLELSDKIRRNPLKGLDLFNAQVDVRHARRELTEQELIRLLEGARQSSRTYKGLTGEDRACLYLAAIVTGFRARALANLKPTDFDLRSEMPMVTLAARFNKSKKPKIQPLTPEAAAVLARYFHYKPISKPVWGDAWLGKGAEMIRHDLEAVGIPYVVEGTHGPEYADFHALRHSYLTLLGRSGVDLRTAQTLAGHSSPNVTARYTHRGMKELSGAVAKLPMLTNREAWTFSEQANLSDESNGCTLVAQTRDILGHSGALSCTQPMLETNTHDDEETLQISRETAVNEAKQGRGPSRIRTCNQGIGHPLVTPSNTYLLTG